MHIKTVDSQSGTTTDLRTGLVWEKLRSGIAIHGRDTVWTLGHAISVKLKTLNYENYGGYCDWRLPTIYELLSLIDSGDCMGTSGRYWTFSEESYAGRHAWFVDIATGAVFASTQSASHSVRVVRGVALSDLHGRGHLEDKVVYPRLPTKDRHINVYSKPSKQ